jgi:transcriptional regulator with XRE-family HTH domain
MSASEFSVFGARLKEARLRIGLSQKQLGIECGLDPFVSSPRINRYELGIHKVDYAFATRLAAILRVPVAYFYAEDNDLAELIRIFGELPAKRRRTLLEIARGEGQL